MLKFPRSDFIVIFFVPYTRKHHYTIYISLPINAQYPAATTDW